MQARVSGLPLPPFFSVALGGIEHEGWMGERVYFFSLSVFLLQWRKHHKLPMAQRLGPRTLFLPPACPTAACYCDWRRPFIPPVTEMKCWWDQIPSLNSSKSLLCWPSFVMLPLGPNASALSFQTACLPSTLPSSVFSLSSSLFPSSAFLSVPVTTSLNINQTGVGGGEQGTP